MDEEQQLEIFRSVQGEEKVPDDNGLLSEQFRKSLQKGWEEHNKEYTRLLTCYINNSSINLKNKQMYKKVFFWISCGIITITSIISVIAMIIVLIGSGALNEKIVQLIPVLVTFLAPLLTLPRIIADYLFHTGDEDAMVQILGKIVEHDNNSLNNK